MINPVIGNRMYFERKITELVDNVDNRLGKLSNQTFVLNPNESVVIVHSSDIYMSLLSMNCTLGHGFYCCLLTGYYYGSNRNHIQPIVENPSFDNLVKFKISETEYEYKYTIENVSNNVFTCSLTSLNGSPCTIEC